MDMTWQEREAAGKPLDIEIMVRSQNWLGDTTMSDVQMGILKAIYGLELSEAEMKAFLEVTEGRPPRKGGYNEVTLLCGVRSGKTDRLASNIALFEALTFDNSILAPGEKGYVFIIAQNVVGAQTAWSYIEGKVRLLTEKGQKFPNDDPLLDPGQGQQKSITGKEIRFSNRVVVATFPCNKAGIRGKTGICGIGDEFAFWDTAEEAESSDVEIFRSMRTRMATMRGKGKLIKITTPFAQRGEAWNDYQNRKTSKQLFVQAPSWVLNPSLMADGGLFLADQQEKDPEAYNREYGAQFGKDGGTYLPAAYVLAAMREDRPDILPRVVGMTYMAWIDVAFSHDIYAFGVAHAQAGRVIFDCILTWRGTKKNPLDPREVAHDLVEPMHHYGLDTLSGDQYAFVPVARDLREEGLTLVEVAGTPERNWDTWQNLKRLLRQKAIELPKQDIIRQDLLSLVLSRAGHGSTPRVAAPERQGFHDDISKVIANLAFHFMPPVSTLDIADWQDTSGQHGLDKASQIGYARHEDRRGGTEEGDLNFESISDIIDREF